MSLLGKLFVVIMLLMSILFLGVTATLYSQRHDWRVTATNYRQAYTDLAKVKNQDIESLTSEIEMLRLNSDSREAELNTAFVQITSLSNELVTTRTQNAELMAQLNPMNTQIGTINQNMQTYMGQVEKLTAQNNQLEQEKQELTRHRDDLNTQVARLYNQLTANKSDVQSLKEDLVAARKDAEDKQLILDRLRIAGIIPEQIIQGIPPVPKIEGEVVAIKTDIDPPMVLINKGKNDRVQPGYTFSIHSNGRLKGRIVVEQVLPGYCAGRVTVEVDPIDVHDKASTWLE